MTQQIQPYPLAWPFGYPRCKERESAIFKKRTLHQAREGLFYELDRLGAESVIISSMIPVRGGGSPFADYQRRVISDPGVAVYFRWGGQFRIVACDKWDRVEDNVHAIKLTIEAMRGLDRWGSTDILNHAFTGLAALPPPEGYRTWDQILGVPKSATLEDCERAFKAKLKTMHPDHGGTHDAMAELNRAIAEARQERS